MKIHLFTERGDGMAYSRCGRLFVPPMQDTRDHDGVTCGSCLAAMHGECESCRQSAHN